MPLRTLALSSTLLLLACGPEGTTVDPGAATGAAENSSGATLRYGKEPRKLAAKTKLGFKASGGGQYAEVNAQFAASVDLLGEGEGLKVLWKLDAIDELELKGGAKPKPAEGEAEVDPKPGLLEFGSGAYIADLRGETDAEASKALPENEARKKRIEAARAGATADGAAKPAEGEGAAAKPAEGEAKPAEGETEGKPQGPSIADQVLQYLIPALHVPTLPEEALAIGAPVKKEEEEEANIFGLKVPIESESTYTLTKIDDSGGSRIAEVEIVVEASGATEVGQGQGMFVVDQAMEGLLLYDLDANVPVSLKMTQTNSMSMGQQGGEFVTLIESTWEPR